MSAISFKISRNDISPALSKLAASAKRPEPVLRAMGTTFKSITEGNFNSVGASYRPKPWAPKRDGTPSILQKSTTLAKSLHLDVTSRAATLRTPMIYAAIHQFGGTINGKPWLRFKTPSGKWVSVRQVKIPARPFFPVEPNGQLTPKAEEKIRAAAMRVIQSQTTKP